VTTTETVNQITTETVEYNVYNFAKSKYTDWGDIYVKKQ
jgi:hypothetical protein